MSSENNTTSHSNHHPKPLPTPNKSASPLPSNLLPSAPASPPTPAPSPTPHHSVSNWQSSLGGGGHEVDEDEDDGLLLKAQIQFSSMGSAQKQKFLVDILNLCDNQQLSFISSFISPRLRKDPFLSFPNEICLRVSTGRQWTNILLHTHVGLYRSSHLSTIPKLSHEHLKYRSGGMNSLTTI